MSSTAVKTTIYLISTEETKLRNKTDNSRGEKASAEEERGKLNLRDNYFNLEVIYINIKEFKTKNLISFWN